jgi:hypothetical protein
MYKEYKKWIKKKKKQFRDLFNCFKEKFFDNIKIRNFFFFFFKFEAKISFKKIKYISFKQYLTKFLNKDNK